MKVHARKRSSYSKELNDYIIRHYPEMPTEDIAVKFNTTQGVVRDRAWRLGIKKSEDFILKPSKELDDYIITHYPTMPTVDIARKFNRPVEYIRHRAQRLGIKKSHASRLILDDYIIKHYSNTPTEDIAKKFNTTPRHLRYRASVLGVKKSKSFRLKQFTQTSHSRSDIYNEKEIEEIGKKYPTTPTKVIAEKYGRTASSIRFLAFRHGWKKEKLWPKEILEFLKQNYSDKYTEELLDEICAKFGKEYIKTQLMYQAKRLNLKKSEKFKRRHVLESNIKAGKLVLTPEQLKFLKENKKLNNHELSQLFNKKFGTQTTWKSISACLRRKGLSRSNEDISRILSENLSELNKDVEFSRKRFKGLRHRPTKIEKKLSEICRDLPIEYTGDGSRDFMVGTHFPDFRVIDQMKCIEVFGDFHHDPNRRRIKYEYTEPGKIEYLKKHGYDAIVIWGKEINNNPEEVYQKVLKFIKNA